MSHLKLGIRMAWRSNAHLKPALIIIGGEPKFKYLLNCNPDAVSVSWKMKALADLTVSPYVPALDGSTFCLSVATCGADYEGPSVYGGPRCWVFNMARAERRVLTARGSARPTLWLLGR